jgi:hypothetical protein
MEEIRTANDRHEGLQSAQRNRDPDGEQHRLAQPLNHIRQTLSQHTEILGENFQLLHAIHEAQGDLLRTQDEVRRSQDELKALVESGHKMMASRFDAQTKLLNNVVTLLTPRPAQVETEQRNASNLEQNKMTQQVLVGDADQQEQQEDNNAIMIQP